MLEVEILIIYLSLGLLYKLLLATAIVHLQFLGVFPLKHCHLEFME